LVGETSVDKVEDLVPFYGSNDDELQLAFNFPFIEAPFEAAPMSAIEALTASVLPQGAWPVWTGSNHDVSRLATRWAEGDVRKVRLALMMLMTLRGTPVLYEGDEIGLQDAEIEQTDVLDPVGIKYWPYYKGRDPERSPMPWNAQPNGGFTAPGVATWLPMTDPAKCNVADQRDDPTSVLHYAQSLIAFRRDHLDMVLGASEPVEGVPSSCWAWRRGDSATVVLNMSDSESSLEGISGRIGVCSGAPRDDEVVSGTLVLAPWTGVIVVAG
jgi:alpha-glucosidase